MSQEMKERHVKERFRIIQTLEALPLKKLTANSANMRAAQRCEQAQACAQVPGWLLLVKAQDKQALETAAARIVEKFGAHGIVPGMNGIPRFKPTDPVNYACHIMGRALTGLCETHPNIPDVVVTLSKEWSERFALATIYDERSLGNAATRT